MLEGRGRLVWNELFAWVPCDCLFFVTGHESAVCFSGVERTISQGRILEKPPSVIVGNRGKCAPLPCCLAVELLVPQLVGHHRQRFGYHVCLFTRDSGSRSGFVSEQPGHLVR